jgi:hypothetical protein
MKDKASWSAQSSNLVDKWHWKIVFGTGVIEVTKIGTDTNSALFFVNRDEV